MQSRLARLKLVLSDSAYTGSAPAQTLASAAIQAPKLLAAPQREKRPFVVGAVKSRWAMTELWDKLAFDLDY